MGKKIIGALALAGVTAFGAVSPVAAQNYYQDRSDYYQDGSRSSGYDQEDRYYADRQAQQNRRYAEQRRRNYYRQHARADQQSYGYDGGEQSYAYQDGYRRQNNGYQCHSGTTGGVVGAIVGGLLGREIGRGGAYNRPSTTGLIVGAGAGALAGRAVGRSGNDCR